MTIFGNARLGRIGYAIMILLMLAFDFGKGPVEQYLVKAHDEIADQLLAPRPVTDEALAEPSEINGRPMPFMLKAHEDIVREVVKSGRKMSPRELEAEIKRRLAALPPITPLSFMPYTPVPDEIKQLHAQRTALAAAFPVAVLVMTGITIIALLFMLSARLRDIGWPQYYLWLILTPVFLPKFVNLPLPPMAVQGLGLLFYAAVGLLALIPSAEDRQPPEPVPAVARPVPRPPAGGGKRAQFGRLNSH